ncbi:hypothetical protein [Desulfopila sp. IMCC35008]|uniref:hypothetical protein n=1 Tax=Desulfopila sp. IMCC35008 TaxID=2653858 RepID=UPI0013D09FB6|nr:hypothetical protein [Desulfopila sp. IMCC35008]
MVRQVTYVYGLILAMVFCNGWGASAYASVSEQTLKETIVILDRARSNGQNEVHRGVDSETFSVIEAKEYRQFLNYLSTRIHYYCEELAGMVSSIEMSELPCNYIESADLPDLTGSPPTPGETQTIGEKIDDLDMTLQAALSQFDEMLLSEQEKIDQQQSSQPYPEAASGTRGDSGERPSGVSLAGNREEEQSAKAEKKSQAGTKSRTAAGGAGSATGEMDREKREDNRGQLPPEENDDIVARQLREAAEKEKDPEIKEKLWEEYRKYKEGIN